MAKRRDLAAALRIYREFHDSEPKRQRVVQVPDTPGSVAVIGQIVAIVYKPYPWSGKGEYEYEHTFGDTGDEDERELELKDKPLLAVSADGKQLYIIRDKSRFYTNRRGIVG